jgi:hypothetical protein
MFAIAMLASSTACEARDIEVNIVPFVWAPQIDGRLEQGPLAVDLDLGPGDVANGLKSGFMGYAEASNDDIILSSQIIFADFQKDSFAPFFGARTNARVFSLEGLAGPRLQVGRLQFVPLAGGRYNRVEGALNRGTPTGIALARSWTTGSVGAMVVYPLNDQVKFRGRGTLGLIGPKNFVSRDLVITLDYRVAKRVSIVGGYRWAFESIEPEKASGLGLNIDVQGPLVGLLFGPF